MFNYLSDFILFSIFGYISEFIYCGVRGKKSGKALRGPYCPIYGVGGLLIMSIVNNTDNIFIVYFLGMILSSFTEYTLSVILELIFKTRWWDYSKRKFNINGRICLLNSLFFGVLSVLVYLFYKPFKEYAINLLGDKIFIITIIIISLIMLIDAIFTILEAIELKKRLDIVEETGTNNIIAINKKFKKIPIKHNFERLMSNFRMKSKKAKIIKKYYDNKD